MAKSKPRSILVICAHADDNVIGPGAAIIKYAREGCEVNTIIFSFGEASHPHYKPDVIRKIRIQEARKVNEFIGGKEIVFLGVTEGRFLKEFDSHIMQKRLATYLMKFKPDIIFTHSKDEFHQDHKNVNKIVRKAYKRLDLKCELFSFDVWNLINFKSGIRMKLIVDVSDTFSDKIRALNMFKSQKLQAILPLTWNLYVKAFMNGFRHDMKFAEVFYKVK